MRHAYRKQSTPTCHRPITRDLVLAELHAAIRAVEAGEVDEAESWIRGAWRELAAYPLDIEHAAHEDVRMTARRIVSKHRFAPNPARPAECRHCGRQADVHPVPDDDANTSPPNTPRTVV